MLAKRKITVWRVELQSTCSLDAAETCIEPPPAQEPACWALAALTHADGRWNLGPEPVDRPFFPPPAHFLSVQG